MTWLGGIDPALVIGWLGAHLYVVVLLGALVDASGIPFPGRLLLVGAGAMARAGHGNVGVVVALALAAAMAMDSAWYLAARSTSLWLLRLYRRLTGRSARDDDRVLAYARRNRALTIVVGRFFTSVRAVAWPITVVRRVGYVRFFAVDFVAAGLWAGLWVGLGWGAGRAWEAAAETAGQWMLVAGALTVALAAGAFALRWWRVRTAGTPGAP